MSKLEGVTSCSVNLLTNSMGVEGNVDPKAIIEAVEAAGYQAEEKEKQEKGAGQSGRKREERGA